MQVTVDIDDDVLAIAKAMVERDEITLGQAISRLARRGLKDPICLSECNHDVHFEVEPDAKAISNEDVYRALSDWP